MPVDTPPSRVKNAWRTLANAARAEDWIIGHSGARAEGAFVRVCDALEREPGIENHESARVARIVVMDSGLTASRRPGMTVATLAVKSGQRPELRMRQRQHLEQLAHLLRCGE